MVLIYNNFKLNILKKKFNCLCPVLTKKQNAACKSCELNFIHRPY